MPDPASATEAREPSPFSINHPIFRLQARLVDCSLEVGWRLKQGTDAEGLAQWQQRRADAWDKLDREIEDYAQQAHAAGVALGREQAARRLGVIASRMRENAANALKAGQLDRADRISERANEWDDAVCEVTALQDDPTDALGPQAAGTGKEETS